MKIIIEETVNNTVVEVVYQTTVVSIKDNVSFLDLTDVMDNSYVGKNGYVPTVNETTGKLELKEPAGGGGSGAISADNVTETSTRVFVSPAEKTAITHANRTILDAIEESLTTSLKTAYDSAVSWIATNGSALISHLSNTSNPHNTTAYQVGAYTTSEVDTALGGKQDTLESGTNIKTVNGQSLLGSGNITIDGGGAVDSVNGQTGVVVLDADDIAETATRLWLTSSLKTAYDNAVTWVANAGENIRATVLTGLSTATTTVVTATDTILEAIGKLQGQLGLKANTADVTRTVFSCKELGTSTSGAGSGTWASLYKRQITAGTITDLDEVGFEGMVEALTNGSTKTIGILINTVDDVATATEIGSSGAWASGASRLTVKREYIQRGTNLRGISTTFANPTDEGTNVLQSSQNSFVDYALNPANSLWVYLAVKGNVSDNFRKCKLEMTLTPNKA